MILGGSLSFFGLLAGAFTGVFLLFIVPAAAGLVCWATASWYGRELEKQAAKKLAAYPSYKY